jgi:hypothetical protein
MKTFVLIISFLLLSITSGAEVKIGIGKKKLTPEGPIWLSGYASRTKPSDGVIHDLWAKAVVVEENSKKKVVIVTTDIIGIPHELSEIITNKVMSKWGISRSQLLLNSSHTHSGPVIWSGLSLMYNLDDSNLIKVVKYNLRLADAISEAVDLAMDNLQPGMIYTGTGYADFAVNRRQVTDKGIVIGINPGGPEDHDVPVLKFTDNNGKMIAVLFGYACHNTTLNGYEVNGDYAGFAQAELEIRYPGAVAMFMEGCGGDQNPDPRRTVESAIKHGNSMSDAVQKVLSGEMKQVRMPVRSYYTTVDLEFPPFSPERFVKELEEDNIYKKRRAKFLFEAYDHGYDLTKVKYPVQAIRFNKDFAILALGGEVVVDYSLRAKQQYPKENLFVAGYSNELPCYIPSARILKEGGYEADENMLYYGLPGPFRDDVEEKIFTTIKRVMRKTGAR